MSGTQLLRLRVSERLSAAVEEIFVLVEKTIAEYQEEAVRSKTEISQLKRQIQQLTASTPQVLLFPADGSPLSEDLNPLLQQCVIKVEPMAALEESVNNHQPQVKEEQVDMEAETSENAQLRHPTVEPTTNCELVPCNTAQAVSVNTQMDDQRIKTDGPSSPHHCHNAETAVEQDQSVKEEKESVDDCGMDPECVEEIRRALPDLSCERLMDIVNYLGSKIGVEKKEDLAYVINEDLRHHLPPSKCCKVIQTFQQGAIKKVLVRSGPSVPTISSLHTTTTSPHNPGLSSSKTQNSWIHKMEIPFEKLPASLLQAMHRGTMAYPADSRAMVRAVVEAMQVHCPTPNKAACIEVAKMIVSKYPDTFTDSTEEGGKYGESFITFVHKIKTRVEHVNRLSKCKGK